MPLKFQNDSAIFSDMVPVDEAERLHEWIEARATGADRATADLGGCTHLHPANLQVLMASDTRVVTWPIDLDLRAWLETALNPAEKEH